MTSNVSSNLAVSLHWGEDRWEAYMQSYVLYTLCLFLFINIYANYTDPLQLF